MPTRINSGGLYAKIGSSLRCEGCTGSARRSPFGKACVKTKLARDENALFLFSLTKFGFQTLLVREKSNQKLFV